MRAVNLLPRETSGRQAGFDRVLVAAVALTVIVLALLGGGFFLEKAHAASERQQLAAVQAALAQAQSEQTKNTSPQALLQVPVVLSQQQPWHVALDAALGSRVAWDVLLQQLEYAVPDKVSLTNITIGASGTLTGTTSGTITIGGTAFWSPDVALLLARLSRIPKLSQVTLVSTTAGTGSSVQTFQITAQMTLPVPPAPAGTATTATTTTTTGG